MGTGECAVFMEKRKFKLEKVDDPNKMETSTKEDLPAYPTVGQGVTVAAFALNEDISQTTEDYLGSEINSESARGEILKAVREEQEKS